MFSRENLKMFLLCEFEQSLIITDVSQNIYTANRIESHYRQKGKKIIAIKMLDLLSHNQHKYFKIIHIPRKLLFTMKYVLVYFIKDS